MSEKETFFSGYKAGIASVFEFLNNVKNIDFEKEFDAWANCDYYYDWEGNKIKNGVGNKHIIEKHFGIDFNSKGGALTLESSEVTEGDEESGYHERTHADGWTIKGQIHEDYYVWVNSFEAKHPKLGRVWGNFENIVHADSEEAFRDFYNNHTPHAWDYGDI